MLDYIEESVNMTSGPLKQSKPEESQRSPSVGQADNQQVASQFEEQHRMTLHDMSRRIEALEHENRNYRAVVEDARRTEASSR